MIPDQYINFYKVLEIYTGYFDSLDIVILFSYPSSIVIMRDYCKLAICNHLELNSTHVSWVLLLWSICCFTLEQFGQRYITEYVAFNDNP